MRKQAQVERLLYTVEQAAAALGISTSTLEKYRASGRGPGYVRPEGGRGIAYPRKELERWIAKRTRASLQEAKRRRKQQIALGLTRAEPDGTGPSA